MIVNSVNVISWSQHWIGFWNQDWLFTFSDSHFKNKLDHNQLLKHKITSPSQVSHHWLFEEVDVIQFYDCWCQQKKKTGIIWYLMADIPISSCQLLSSVFRWDWSMGERMWMMGDLKSFHWIYFSVCIYWQQHSAWSVWDDAGEEERILLITLVTIKTLKEELETYHQYSPVFSY